MEFSITITDAAQVKIMQLLNEEKLSDAKFRLYVSLSHATGYQCSYTIDNEVNDDDLVLDYQIQDVHFTVLIDSMSLQYLNGASVDCKQNESEIVLIITNPNTAKE